MADEWRKYLYLGLEPDGYHFVVPQPNAAGLPGRATLACVPMNYESFRDLMYNPPDLIVAVMYWEVRDKWRAFGVEAFGALYDKWLPKRDAILGKEEHLGKSRAEWERFYLALADERAAREYAQGKVSANFGLDGKELLKAMQQGGRAG